MIDRLQTGTEAAVEAMRRSSEAGDLSAVTSRPRLDSQIEAA